MQYVCRYGIDPARPLDGIIVADIRDDEAIDMANPAFAGCVVVPSDELMESFPKVGPEPALLGDPPTETHPDHAELDEADVPRHLTDDSGEPLRDADGDKIPHPLRLKAGRPYADNRHTATDFRPRAAPPQSDPNVQRAYLGRVRWLAEIGGTVVGGFPAFTTREAVPVYAAAAVRASRDPKYTKTMTGRDGKAYDLDADKLVAVSDGVQDHVDACFAVQGGLLPDIAAGKIESFKPIDAAFAKLKPA